MAPCGSCFARRCTSPGAKTLLGTRYGEDGEDGSRARHQGAVRASVHGALRGAQAGDALRQRRAARGRPWTAWRSVFRSSGGDLKAVADALIDLPEAWQDDRRKFRAPQDWLVAVLRALGATDVRENVGPLLRQLRQPLWSPAAPKGYGDTMQEWADPDSLLNRGELARTIARMPGLRDVDPRSLLEVVDLPAECAAGGDAGRHVDRARRARGAGAGRPRVPMEIAVRAPMHRRAFLQSMCYGGLATFALPSVAFAQVRRPGRFVFVLLRGGFDGLAAVVPAGDPAYRASATRLPTTRPTLAMLDDTFGLAPGLAPLRAFWDEGQLAVAHAMAIPHRTRSHFDGQAVLESGLDKPVGSSDGWLNRLLQVMDGHARGHRHRRGHAAVADRRLRRAELVADATRRRGRRVSRAAGGVVSRRRRAAQPLRGRHRAAGAWWARSRWRAAGRAATAPWR